MRRYFYTIACGLLAYTAHGQIGADLAGHEAVADVCWVKSTVDSAGTCTEVLHWSGPSGLVRVYYASGRLRDYWPYDDVAAARQHGVATTWYESGQLCTRQVFLQGRRDSTLLLYHENGQLKRKTRYIADSELPGLCFDSAGVAIPYFLYEQPPLYPGGQLRLTQEISQLMSRKRLSKVRLLGTGWYDINFVVKEDGSIGQPDITVDSRNAYWVRSLPDATSKQALAEIVERERSMLLANARDALAKLPIRFSPGKRDGATVRWHYHLRVTYDYVSGRSPL